MYSIDIKSECRSVLDETELFLSLLDPSDSRYPLILHHLRSLLLILDEEIDGVETTSALRKLVEVAAKLPIS